MRNLLDGLEEAGLDFDNVVAANVYLDDVQDFENMNRIYKLFFHMTPPARTTVQQHAAVTRKANEREQWPTLEQISLVAVGGRTFELKANSPQFEIPPESLVQVRLDFWPCESHSFKFVFPLSKPSVMI